MSKDLTSRDSRTFGKGQFLVYETEDGQVKIDVRLEDETVWLTQQHMVELFQSSQQNISHHVRSIYEEGELFPEAIHKKYLSVRREGNRDVKRLIDDGGTDIRLCNCLVLQFSVLLYSLSGIIIGCAEVVKHYVTDEE